MDDRICCCSGAAAGAISIALQFMMSAVGLASAILIIGSIPITDYTTSGGGQLPAAAIVVAGQLLPSITTTTTTIAPLNGTYMPPIAWYDAWIELAAVWYIGFAAVWMLSLLIALISFRYYRPVLVVPNIVVLMLGIFFNGIAFGSILAWLLNIPPAIRASDYAQVMLIYVMGLFVVIFLANFMFIYLTARYHSYLRRQYNNSTATSTTITKKVTLQTPPPAAESQKEPT